MGNRFLEKLITFLFDALAINGAFLCAVWLRFQSGFFSSSYNPDMVFSNYFIPSLMTTVLWLFFYFLTGLYRDWFKESRLDEFLVVARTVIIGILVLFVMLVSDQLVEFVQTGRLPNLFSQTRVATLFTYGGCLLVSSTAIRFIMHTLYANLYKKGIAVRNLAIVGAHDTALKLINEVKQYPQLGYKFVGFIDEEMSGEYEGNPIIGKFKDIPHLTKEQGINGLVISHLTNSADDIMGILNYCWDENLTIYMEPSLMDVISGHLKTHEVAGVPLIVLLQDHMPRWEAQIKRLFDIVVSLFILIPFFPCWVLVGLLVKLTDRGPAVYSQERIGQNGKPFVMHKFRSMYTDAEAKSGPQWATDNDPRITPFGRFMRKTRLDEIPQMWNVLKGEMSFVGPRPERQHFIDMLSKEIPWYVKRLKMKPGVTGWAQVKHKYDETIEDVKTKVMYDLYYFENMSILLDLKIIIQTVMVVFTGKGAK